MDVGEINNSSWIIKAILKQMENVQHLQTWIDMQEARKFSMKKMHHNLLEDTQKVDRRYLFYGNVVRPRSLFTLWLACHERFATKDKMVRFGVTDNANGYFCNAVGTHHHLLFECP